MRTLRFILFTITVLLFSCTTDRPVVTPINGHSTVQTTHRFLGIPVWTSNDEARTAEQKREKIEIDKERREVDIDLKTEERQSFAAFVAGCTLFGLAIVGVFAGYFTQGWKFWAGFSFISSGLGMVCWQSEHVVVSPAFKWSGFALLASAVGWSMWKMKHFSFAEYRQKRKQQNQEKEDGSSSNDIR